MTKTFHQFIGHRVPTKVIPTASLLHKGTPKWCIIFVGQLAGLLHVSLQTTGKKEFCMPNLGDHNVYLINEEFTLSNECCLNLNVDLWQPVCSVSIQDVKTRTWSRKNSYNLKGTITFKRAIRREKPESVRCLIPMIRNADTQICFRVGFMDSMTCFSSWNFLFAKHCTRASILLKTCWIVSCLGKQKNIKCRMKH